MIRLVVFSGKAATDFCFGGLFLLGTTGYTCSLSFAGMEFF